MAGHNKWSKIKRQKAREDKKKAKKWANLSREITVAAREGGGDPELNPSLSQVIERAKEANMPKENIGRAIKKGTGELEDGGDYEDVTYEGYSPQGVAVFIEATTDNLNRTAADVRHVFTKLGGNLGQSGSVDYMFERMGVVRVPGRHLENGRDELELFELAVEAGAEDMDERAGDLVFFTPFQAFNEVRDAFEEAGIDDLEAHLERIPTTTVTEDEETVEGVIELLDELDELDDVQNVYTPLTVDGRPIRRVSFGEDEEE